MMSFSPARALAMKSIQKKPLSLASFDGPSPGAFMIPIHQVGGVSACPACSRWGDQGEAGGSAYKRGEEVSSDAQSSEVRSLTEIKA